MLNPILKIKKEIEKLKLSICKYTKADYDSFKDMFETCFKQDYKIELTESQIDEICTSITQQVADNIIYLDLLFLNEIAKGFVCYQIDSPKSDWCEKEGWGCIRELYISRDCRKKGYGRILVCYSENELRKNLAYEIYLTSDDTKEFWIKLGYSDTGEICKKNGSPILEKIK